MFLELGLEMPFIAKQVGLAPSTKFDFCLTIIRLLFGCKILEKGFLQAKRIIASIQISFTRHGRDGLNMSGTDSNMNAERTMILKAVSYF